MHHTFFNNLTKRLPTGSSFALRLSERKLLLFFGDLAITIATLVFFISNTLPDFDPANESWSRYFDLNDGLWLSYSVWITVYTICWACCASIFDVYNLKRSSDWFQSIVSTGSAAFVAGLVYAFVPYLSPPLAERRLYIFVLPLVLLVAVVIWRLIYAVVFAQPQFQHRVIVVGAGESASYLTRMLKVDTDLPDVGLARSINVLGLIKDNQQDTDSASGVKVLGDSNQLTQMVASLKPNEIVLASANLDDVSTELWEHVVDCCEQGIQLSTMPAFFERVSGRIPVSYIGRNITNVISTTLSPVQRIEQILIRFIDMIAGLVGCLILIVAIPFVALANYFTDKGSLFYRQTRVGKGGATFEIIKFRSMIANAEETSGAMWADENDDRITPLGKLLRLTRMDELPQFWNILKGEMSLVGPRPERPYFVEQLDSNLPFYRVRHSVKPGLTGWAQVNYKYGASVEDSRRKLEYDLYYIKHQGIVLYLQVVLKTILVIFGLKGR